jgi:UDP-N-acetylglucosamine 2-epimerase (non-hydrolysing)
MRQCVFIIGTRAQLVKLAPVLKLASAAGLKHSVWFTQQGSEPIDDVLRDLGIKPGLVHSGEQRQRLSVLNRLTWLPVALLGCYRHVHSFRIWTQSAPLVVVHADTLSSFIGALAGRFAGGWIVHLESGVSSGKIADPFPLELMRRFIFRLTNFALCDDDKAYARMRRYHCKVVHTSAVVPAGHSDSQDSTSLPARIVNSLAGWSR